MEPTPEEMAAWRTVDDIIDWSGMQGDGDEPESPRGSFITMLGISGTTHWRVVALMPPDVSSVRCPLGSSNQARGSRPTTLRRAFWPKREWLGGLRVWREESKSFLPRVLRMTTSRFCTNVPWSLPARRRLRRSLLP